MKNWSTQEIEMLKTHYYNNESIKKIQLFFADRTICSIKSKIRKLKLKRDCHFRKSNLKILLENTPQSYYWIGYLLADGHFSTNGFIKFSIKDKDALGAYIDYIKSTNKVKKETGGCETIKTRDIVTVKKLMKKFDISNKKTYFPPNKEILNINKNLLLALLIGLVDGDGSIVKNNTFDRYYITFHNHISWQPFFDSLAIKLTKIFKIKFNKSRIQKDGYLSWNISNFEAVKLIKKALDKLDIFYLKRKWDKIQVDYISPKQIIKRNIEDKVYKEIKNGVKLIDIAKKLGLSLNQIYYLSKKFKSNHLYK